MQSCTALASGRIPLRHSLVFQTDFVYAKENQTEKQTVAERYAGQICPQVVWLMLVNSRA